MFIHPKRKAYWLLQHAIIYLSVCTESVPCLGWMTSWNVTCSQQAAPHVQNIEHFHLKCLWRTWENWDVSLPKGYFWLRWCSHRADVNRYLLRKPKCIYGCPFPLSWTKVFDLNCLIVSVTQMTVKVCNLRQIMYCVSKHVHPQEVPDNPLYTRGYKEDRARLYSVVPFARPRGNRDKLEHMRFSVWTSGNHFYYVQALYKLSREAVAPYPWRYSKAIWMWFCATYCRVGRGCSNRGIGPEELQEFLKTLTILWFLYIRSLQMAWCHGLFLLVKFHNWEQRRGGKIQSACDHVTN